MNHVKTIITSEYKTVGHFIENASEGIIFLTGNAGTGKSTFLRYFLSMTKKNIVLLAPTGKAAVNIGGATIHSFFKFNINILTNYYPQYNVNFAAMLEDIDIIVIDEFGMLRADLIDAIDAILRKNADENKPFGGKLIFGIGDLYQLPPVLTSREQIKFAEHYKGRYFFNSNVFKKVSFKYFELTKTFRQNDTKFINLLNNIRISNITQGAISAINKKLLITNVPANFKGTILTSLKRTAEKINDFKLEQINTDEFIFHAEISGRVNPKSIQVPEILKLKATSRIVFCRNTIDFQNGETGTIINIDNYSIKILKDDNKIIYLNKIDYNFYEYSHRNKANIIGIFRQYPIKLAYAITIHKSQGMTLNCDVIIATGNNCFESGQFYVAISRVANPKRLRLLNPLKLSDIKTDKKVSNFINKYR